MTSQVIAHSLPRTYGRGMTETENARSVAERYAAAWLANDLDNILDCYADDFTLHYFGNNPFTGDHVGKQAAIDLLLETGARAPRTLVAVDDVLAGPSSAVIVTAERILIDGVDHDIRRVLRYRIVGSRFTECWLYEEDQAVVDRAWADR